MIVVSPKLSHYTSRRKAYLRLFMLCLQMFVRYRTIGIQKHFIKLY